MSMSETAHLSETYALKTVLKRSILWVNEFERSSPRSVTMHIRHLNALTSHEVKKPVKFFNPTLPKLICLQTTTTFFLFLSS